MTPIYIQEMLNIKVNPYDLRDPSRTVKPKAKTSLPYKGNHILNSLPVHIKGAESPGILKG